MTKVLGLDISTSYVGVCFLDSENLSNPKMEAIDLTKIKDFYDKYAFVKNWILSKKDEIDTCDFIFVEEPVLMFGAGASTASVIALLQQFNACVRCCLFDSAGVKARLINVSATRRLIGVKTMSKAKSGGKNHKQQTFEQVLAMKMVDDKDLPKTKTGSYKPYAYDMVDAFVIARGGILQA